LQHSICSYSTNIALPFSLELCWYKEHSLYGDWKKLRCI